MKPKKRIKRIREYERTKSLVWDYLKHNARNKTIKVQVMKIVNITHAPRMKICDVLIELVKENKLKKLGQSRYKLNTLTSFDLDHYDDEFFRIK